MLHDLPGDTSEKELLNSLPSVGTDDDKARALLPGRLYDHLRRVALPHQRLHGHLLLLHARLCLLQVLLRLLLHRFLEPVLVEGSQLGDVQFGDNGEQRQAAAELGGNFHPFPQRLLGVLRAVVGYQYLLHFALLLSTNRALTPAEPPSSCA